MQSGDESLMGDRACARFIGSEVVWLPSLPMYEYVDEPAELEQVGQSRWYRAKLRVD